MMDLPCAQWQNHVAQRWTKLDPETREHFTSLREIDDVFKCSLTLTTQDDVDFVQSISAGVSAQKDTDKAAKCREKGNSSFKTRDYSTAARHYSQGICLASPSSEQLSLCFANRSAALYHLQRYQESLEDIDRALNSGYPSHLVHKLEERRTQCIKHLSAGQKVKDYHRNPSNNHADPASEGPLMLGLSPQVSVGCSKEKGRHLVAAERIAAGEVILCDRPYSCVLIPGMEEVKGSGVKQDRRREELEFGTEQRRCHRCLTETLRPVPCEGCSYSRYCSTSCQREAWEQHHRWECPLGGELRAMGVMAQLALRVTLKAGLKNIHRARDSVRDEHRKSSPSYLNAESRDLHHHSDSYLSVFHLLHHLSRHSPAQRFLCAVTVSTLYLKLSQSGFPAASWGQSADGLGGITDPGSGQWLLGSTVLRHFLQLRCNAQAVVSLQDTGAAELSVQSSREIRIATAVFPTLSLLNHSCCPNTSLFFSTGGDAADLCGSDVSADLSETDEEERGRVTVIVRAARVISPGQEILHCYGPHSSRLATQERQRLLQEQYYFLCQCEACTLQEQQPDEGEEGRQQCAGGRPQEAGLLCGKCRGSLKKSTEDRGLICPQASCGHRMSPSEVSRRLEEVRDGLEKAVDLMERDRPDEALKLLKRTQRQSVLVLAETHPLQGELEDATARAYATMGDWSSAASHLERSAAAIASQYGDDSIELGRQLFKVAQLHFNGGARGPALAVIPKVKRLLSLHCGPRCGEIQELQAMEDCLRG